MTNRDLQASPNEVFTQMGYRKAATRRLDRARRTMRKAQNRSAAVRRFAERELACALAEAQEWGVGGKVGAR
jgi:hypothetical protein